jgi:threonine/homoserine/homoserine lactone efflux protein
MSNRTDVHTALGLGVIVIGGCILLRAIPLLVLGGVIYLFYLASKREKSGTKENTTECKPGDQKK